MRTSLWLVAALTIASVVVARPDARAQAPAAPAGEPGAISGIVLDAATHTPIASAYVFLSAGYYGTARLAQATDARGRFVFQDVVPGDTYVLRAMKPGYFEGIFRALSSSTAPALVVAPKQWLRDIRIELKRPASIAGRVTDEAGEPVVGAYVRTIVSLPIGGRAQVATGPGVRTDDRGMYRIGGLAEGRYVVSVPSSQDTVNVDTPFRGGGQPAGPGSIRDVPVVDVDARHRLVVGGFATPPRPADGRVNVYPIMFFPAALTFSEATAVVLRAGEERAGVDIQLRPVPSVSVSGRVVATTPGTSAAGLTLRLLPEGIEDLGFGSQTASTVIGNDGEFTFVGVPRGKYTIDARRYVLEYRFNTNSESRDVSLPSPPATLANFGLGGSEVAGIPGTGFYAAGGPSGDGWVSMPLEVGDSDLTNVTVPLNRSVTLSGRIVPEVAAAGARTGPRPTIFAEPAGGSPALGLPISMSGPPGQETFSVPGLRPAPYFLRTLGGRIMTITWNGKDYTNAPFDGAEGHDFTDIVITTTTRTTSISGTVTNAAAAPNGTMVLVFPTDATRWTNALFPSAGGVFTVPVDTANRYRASPAPGEYYLVPIDGANAQRRDAAFLSAVAANAVRVTVTWDDKKTQDLKFAEVAR